MEISPKRFQTRVTVDDSSHGQKLFDFLANSITPKLSKAMWKKCIESGGVWLKNAKEKKRLKRVTTLVQKGDSLEIFFDPKAIQPTILKFEPTLVHQQKGISCWYKPPDLLTQGSPYGDDASLQSFVSKKIKPTFLIHRLDRETEGLVLMAHEKEMAAKLNLLFSQSKVAKAYFALVIGTEPMIAGSIDQPLEGKSALTHFEPVSDEERQKLWTQFPETKEQPAIWVKLLPQTGRKHQLRIHLQSIKRPLLHDPRYSRTGKMGKRLYLVAYYLKCEELKLEVWAPWMHQNQK